MKKAILWFLVGTAISFLAQLLFFGLDGRVGLDLYYAISFGLGWGIAYYVDQPNWTLTKKMLISFLGIVCIVLFGLIWFDWLLAVPSIIRFSTVFVAYYLLASFRTNKSLRQ